MIVIQTILVGCKVSSNPNHIYQLGRKWTYDVHFLDGNGILTDSCRLVAEVKKGNFVSFLAGQQNLTYTYEDCCRKTIYESTGVDEDTSGVFIHPPRQDCFAFTQIAPMPSISLPPDIGSKREIELKVVKSTLKELNGKTVAQILTVTGVDSFAYKEVYLPVYVLEGQNTNYREEFGIYHCRFFFNEKLGFVLLEYVKPDGQKVIIRLVETNF